MPDQPSPLADRAAEQVSFPLDADLVMRLELFQCRNPDFTRRDDAVRHILRLWLTENGYDGVHEDLGRRPEMLNASNDD
jgi:hypothetical protein